MWAFELMSVKEHVSESEYALVHVLVYGGMWEAQKERERERKMARVSKQCLSITFAWYCYLPNS
jgi:hypothetical protein